MSNLSHVVRSSRRRDISGGGSSGAPRIAGVRNRAGLHSGVRRAALNVEVVFVDFDAESQSWRFRTVESAVLKRQTIPQAARLVASSAGLDDTEVLRDVLLHGTSWREKRGSDAVWHTFVAHVDSHPGEHWRTLDSQTIAHGGRPDEPQPDEVTDEHVAAHALRHLAFLSRTDDVVHEYLGRHRGLVEALGRVDLGLAGELSLAVMPTSPAVDAAASSGRGWGLTQRSPGDS